MKQVVIGFGLLITALLILFRVAGIFHLFNATYDNIWIAIFSLVFLGIGILLSRKMFTREVIVIQAAPTVINKEQLLKEGISKREAEILLLMHEGLSNQQIADQLFISENTIKKHISNIFLKLNVDRRTEAVKRALELSVITK